MRKIKFSRVGGLSPVLQKGYTTDSNNRSYHTPPSRKGFYAFIYPNFDIFLLGGEWSKLGKKNKHEKFEYLKDKNGDKIKYYKEDYPYEKVLSDSVEYINPKILKHMIQDKKSKFDVLTSKYFIEDIRDVNGDFVNAYLIKKKKLKVFYHTGELWHHLKNSAIKPFEIIKEVGDWIKTDYNTFVRAYEQDRIDNVKMLKKDGVFPKEEINIKNVYKFISKEHLEVFIERLK